MTKKSLNLILNINQFTQIFEKSIMLKFYIGLGIRNFSAAPKKIPAIRQTLKKLYLSEAEETYKNMLNAKTLDEIKKVKK